MKAIPSFGSALSVAMCLSVTSVTQATPPVPQAGMLSKTYNACLPVAASCAQTLRSSGIWARVLQTSNTMNSKIWGHSMVVFIYPQGSNNVWTYDYRGSYPVKADVNDPLSIAKMAFSARGEHHQVIAATYLDSANQSAAPKSSLTYRHDASSAPTAETNSKNTAADRAKLFLSHECAKSLSGIKPFPLLATY